MPAKAWVGMIIFASLDGIRTIEQPSLALQYVRGRLALKSHPCHSPHLGTVRKGSAMISCSLVLAALAMSPAADSAAEARELLHLLEQLEDRRRGSWFLRDRRLETAHAKDAMRILNTLEGVATLVETVVDRLPARVQNYYLYLRIQATLWRWRIGMWKLHVALWDCRQSLERQIIQERKGGRSPSKVPEYWDWGPRLPLGHRRG
jgi:hypothetical protein